MSRFFARVSALVLTGALAAASLLAFPAPQSSQAVRIGGDIKPPAKTKNVAPVYPAIARQNKVQGVVMLDVTVGTDGKVKDIKVLRSIKELDDAAITAVRGWEYKPTLMNGQAVPVIMTVPVIFTLE
jgi:protein TonB